MGTTINLEPNWQGMRAWVRHVAHTEPQTALAINAAMGSEAADLTGVAEKLPYSKLLAAAEQGRVSKPDELSKRELIRALNPGAGR